MSYQHIAVVLNGEFPYPERQLSYLDSCDYIIAADGGLNWLYANRRQAHVVIGDLDSAKTDAILASERAGAEILRHPCEKDETDSELALALAASLAPRQITILGATGGRTDHLLANILLLCMDALSSQKVAIYDGCSLTFLIHQQKSIRGNPGDILSLIPLKGDAKGVSTTGLYYPLNDETLRFGPARGISNVLTECVATVSLKAGLLLAVHTPVERV